MGSILSNNQSTAQDSTTQNPTTAVNNLINQILSSANPQQMFNNMVSNNKDAQNAMNLINQYGNGDPKAAFRNYAAATGKQSFGQQIKQKFGLD